MSSFGYHRYKVKAPTDTWKSSNFVDPISETANVLGVHVDIPHEDLTFLLGKIPESASAKTSVQSLVLKLKLEFGDELAKLKQDKEAARRKSEEDKKALIAKRKADWEREVKKLTKQSKEYDDMVREISSYLSKYTVTHFRQIPDEMMIAFDHLLWGGSIRRRVFSRRLYMISEPVNPFKASLEETKRNDPTKTTNYSRLMYGMFQ